jgi:hypothetical protein
MTKKLFIRGMGLALAGVLGAAQPAFADSLNLYGWWGGYQWDASMTLEPGLVNYHNGSTVSSVTNEGPFGAGGFNTLDSTNHTSFESWCVDVFHDFYFNSSTSQGNATLISASAMFGAAKAADLGRLATEAFPLVSGHNSSNVNSTAFQLAVWEIVNENTGHYDLYSGNFRAGAGGGATAVAQGWLNNLPATSTYEANIWAMGNNGAGGWGPQDVAVFAPVPEPETYAMLMAGLGLLGAVARRRKAKVR